VIISAISQYLGCAETVPLSQRVSELELQLKKLSTLIESYSSTEEGNQ